MTSNSVTQLGSLQTEAINDQSSTIDLLSTLDICRVINDADSTVASAVNRCVPEIAKTIDLIVDRVRENGRVIYIGAGTSGRLGVLDASEIPPTFSAPYEQFIALMAGGDTAIRRAVEGAEDSTAFPIDDLTTISPPLTSLDTLIGIAASGRTPYVLSGLSYARSAIKMLTVGISCVDPSQMRGRCDCLIECVVGPEIVTGSTRMKAGTATKMILNMISTGVMIRIGKTYGNLMVDVKSSNFKLVERARRIYRTILPTTTLSDQDIDGLISSCSGSVKLALVVGKLGCSVEEASQKLSAAGGVLKKAWQVVESDGEGKNERHDPPQAVSLPKMVLCIDAGGTKCSAVISGPSGILARAEGGPCNFVTMGHEPALLTISAVSARAVSLLPSSVEHGFRGVRPIFVAAWIGGAGLDRAHDLVSIKHRISQILSIPESALFITNDAALLSSAIVFHSNETKTKTGIVLITGTGSIAYSFGVSQIPGSSLPVPLERTGGWGYLLGDEGSAFSIGREAIRAALRQRDLGLAPTAFHLDVMNYLKCRTISEIISAVYDPTHQISGDIGTSVDPKLRIAGLCPVVFGHAFRPGCDEEALLIVRASARCAAEIVMQLLGGEARIESKESTLVLGGALAQVSGYRDFVVDFLTSKNCSFACVEAVGDVAGLAVRLLVRDFL